MFIDYDMIDTCGLIRIHNYYENDKGYGTQIEDNDIDSILDMQDNFNWSFEKIIECIKSNEYNAKDDYIFCDNEGFYSSNHDCTRLDTIDFLESIGTPNGELMEIIKEEFYYTNEYELGEEND